MPALRSFGIETRAIALNGDGLQAWQMPTSQATERKTNASSIEKPHWSTSSFAASSVAACIASWKSPSEVPCVSHASGSSVTGQTACLPFSTSKRATTSPPISTPVPQISPSPIDACMSPTANMPPGCRTGKKSFAPGPCWWSSRLPPWRPAQPFVISSPSVATPTTPTIGRSGKLIRSFIWIVSSSTSKTYVTGERTCVDQLSELRNDRREAAGAGADLEQLDDERVARLGAAHRDRPGGAVHAREVDVADEIVLRLDLPGEAVVRLEADGRPGLDLEHRLEVGPEAPDHLVAGDDVIDGDCRHQRCLPLSCHVSAPRSSHDRDG